MSTIPNRGQDWSGIGSMVNRDPETGIRYGIIPSNMLSSWALDDIYQDGKDLDWENYVAEIKKDLRRVVERIRDIRDAADTDSDTTTSCCEELLENMLSDYLRHGSIAGTVMEIYNDVVSDDPVETVVEAIYESISQDISDHYPGSDGCTPMEYSGEGYEIRADRDGDVWVFKSPYFTYAKFCSPCAPGACYLKDPLDGPHEPNKCYCLGFDWFEEVADCPYPIYSMATGQQI